MSANYLYLTISAFCSVLIHAQVPLINPGTPSGVPDSFDCAVRYYAYEYGQQIQSRHGNFVSLFDSLQLQACNYTRPDETPRKIPNYHSPNLEHKKKKYNNIDANNNNCTFYVSPMNGSDLNTGTSPYNPFADIQTAIIATRNARDDDKYAEYCIINLMEGTFYLESTVLLSSKDSNLTIQNYNGEEVIISGGLPIDFKNKEWKLEKYESTQWRNYSNLNNVYGRANINTSTDLVVYLGSQDSYADCQSAVESSSDIFHSFTWHSTDYRGPFSSHCYGIRDFSWQPVIEDNIYSGRYIGSNIYSNDVNNIDSFDDGYFTGLRINNERGIRARFPDQIPEIGMQFDPLSGWITPNTKWVEPINYPDAIDIIRNSSSFPGIEWPMDGPGGTPWTGEGDWGDFWLGKGGPCNTSNLLGGVDPPYGYWCSSNAPRGITRHECPSGIYFDSSTILPNAPYNDVSHGIVHAWRPSHWYTWMWECDNDNYNKATNSKVLFKKGGFQGGEGETSGAEWYLENIFEELTMPNEWFYNKTQGKLYYFYNSTSKDGIPSNFSFVGTNLAVLINVTGTQKEPVQNITIRGLTFRDTRHTFMDPHGLPSGGDWALQRQGAVFLQGTENCIIDSNLFTRLDGIGLFISNYNRYTRIINNDFEWIGDSAMAAWGYTTGLEDIIPGMGPDGRDGDQPRHTYVENNLIHEIGIWEKQSSFWFQAQSCQTHIINNIFFNGPRAGINNNDGFGGDNHIIGNLLLNTCRESGDHGPWNSWDRVPYITNVSGNGDTIIPEWNHIHNNFIIGTYQSTNAIDTDDGSSYYKTYDNFFVYATYGLKSDFGGHDNRHFSNVYAYTGNFFLQCCTSGANDWFVNNSIVVRNNNGYTSNCDLPDGTSGMQIYNNSVYLPSGNLNVCNMSFEQWQSEGNDPGTTIHGLPTDEELINLGKEKLKNN